MTAPALFPEPERVDVPTEDGPWTISPTGWRYMLLGEDGETLFVQGHLRDDAVTGVLAVLPDHYGVVCLDDVGPSMWTWARELTACPKHAPKDAEDDCRLCYARPDDPFWDWTTPEGQPNANRYARGYFPATVIQLEV